MGGCLLGGNVGIGTNNPLYALDVSSTSAAPFRVGVGATNALVVNSTGLVGIGTNNSTTALDVNGTVTASIFTSFSGTLTLASSSYITMFTAVNNSSYIISVTTQASDGTVGMFAVTTDNGDNYANRITGNNLNLNITGSYVVQIKADNNGVYPIKWSAIKLM